MVHIGGGGIGICLKFEKKSPAVPKINYELPGVEDI